MKDSSIDQALDELEKAIEQKRAELKKKSFPQYSPLVSILAFKTISSLGSLQRIIRKAEEISDAGLSKLQQEVGGAPWQFLSKVGLISLGIGLIFGNRFAGRGK